RMDSFPDGLMVSSLSGWNTLVMGSTPVRGGHLGGMARFACRSANVPTIDKLGDTSMNFGSPRRRRQRGTCENVHRQMLHDLRGSL
ncbi:MAG: hypothetical protein ABIR94_21745, partial [Rubrivivax sp.]